MLKHGQYQFVDGRIIDKPTKLYPTIYDFEKDLKHLPLEHVEFYADYFGWYSKNKLYGSNRRTGELTAKIAALAEGELARRKGSRNV